jgi:LysM repeat protein
MSKRFLSILFIGFVWSSLSAQKQSSTSDYIQQYKDIAIREMQQYQIPASIKMAQGILESSSGNSKLAKEARNHFGIKCKKSWTGPTFIQDDDAKDECFRKYETALDSYEDHSQFLKTNPRYGELFNLDISDYKGWAHGLKKCGYATNPQYAQLLIRTIEEHKLYELDKGGDIVAEKPKEKNKTISTQPRTPRSKSNNTDLPDFELKQQGGRSVMVRNRVQYIVVKQGDSFEKLSKELELMSWQLPKYNDLSSSSKLQAGDILYIQPKRRKATASEHVVKSGESMRSISQTNAIKLSRLYKLNQIEEGNEPREGQKLKLR